MKIEIGSWEGLRKAHIQDEGVDIMVTHIDHPRQVNICTRGIGGDIQQSVRLLNALVKAIDIGRTWNHEMGR